MFHLATSYPFQDLYRVVFERVLGTAVPRGPQVWVERGENREESRYHLWG